MTDCLMCGEPITDLRPQPVDTMDGPRTAHRECLLLNTIGHTFRVCGCHGFGTDHAAALELLRRMDLASPVERTP